MHSAPGSLDICQYNAAWSGDHDSPPLLFFPGMTGETILIKKSCKKYAPPLDRHLFPEYSLYINCLYINYPERKAGGIRDEAG